MSKVKAALEQLGILRGAARRTRPLVRRLKRANPDAGAAEPEFLMQQRAKMMEYALETIISDSTMLISELAEGIDVDNDGAIFDKSTPDLAVEHEDGFGYLCMPCATMLAEEGKKVDSVTPITLLKDNTNCIRCKQALTVTQPREE